MERQDDECEANEQPRGIMRIYFLYTEINNA